MTKSFLPAFFARIPAAAGQTALLSGLLAFYLLVTQSPLYSPGRIYDTLMDEHLALISVEQWKNKNYSYILTDGSGFYHGKTTSVLMFPVMLILGPSWALVRLWPIALGVLTLWTTFVFVRRIFGPSEAFLTLFLLVIHPPFVMGTKLGAQFITPNFFVMASLNFLYRWWTTRRARYLCLGTGLVGLGLGTRLWFGWFALSLFVTAFLFWTDIRRRFAVRQLLNSMILGGLGFLGGSGFNVPREVAGGFPSFKGIIDKYRDAGQMNPHTIEHFFDSLLAVLKGFYEMLSGQYLFSFLGGGGEASLFANRLYPPAFWLSLGLSFFLFRKTHFRKPVFFLLSMCSLMLAVSFLSPIESMRDVISTKFYIFYPFIQILIAVSFIGLLESVRKFRAAGSVLFGLMLLFNLQDISLLAEYYQRINTTGGTGRATDAIYDLARWVKLNASSSSLFVAFHPNIPLNLHLMLPDNRPNILVISPHAGFYEAVRASDKNVFDYLEDVFQSSGLGPIIVIKDIASGEGMDDFNIAQDFATQRRRPLKKIIEFYEKDGSTAFQLYQLPRESSPPTKAFHRLFKNGGSSLDWRRPRSASSENFAAATRLPTLDKAIF